MSDPFQQQQQQAMQRQQQESQRLTQESIRRQEQMLRDDNWRRQQVAFGRRGGRHRHPVIRGLVLFVLFLAVLAAVAIYLLSQVDYGIG
jgi:hypothetical protein